MPENIRKFFQIEPGNMEKAGSVSSFIKKKLKENNISKKLIRRVSIATYEAEINVVIHSYGGTAFFELKDNLINITFFDRGPGIINIDKAMQAGYTTANKKARENGFGAGMGLPNINSVVDEIYIKSSESGTTLNIKFYIKEDDIESN